MTKLLCLGILLTAGATHGEGTTAKNSIPWSQIGAKAGADYNGNGLAVTPTESGARLHCVFQRLDGEATPEGLWLTSTVTDTVSDRFRITAMAVGRIADGPLTPCLSPSDGERVADRPGEGQLPRTGSVSVCGQTVRFSRPGLTEEYSVSMDGVRQDFIVEESFGRARLQPSRPSRQSAGDLVVKLAVTGAKVESAAYGARLVLEHSGRKIAYSRLRVTDATGKQLPARIEVSPADEEAPGLTSWSESRYLFEPASLFTPVVTEAQGALAVVVDDTDAVYPVRIDPTFSDANWISMGGVPGTDGWVSASVVDASGNLYIGGQFTVAGDTVANNVAKWNGSSWSAMRSGVSRGNSTAVLALAVSGSTLYAGGDFTTAGGIAATNIAQWNGSNWSALGSGMNLYGYVFALAASRGRLYAGGAFTTAGGSAANYIAQWNGSNWSPLGSGMDNYVYALAIYGGTLYAGGAFTTAGGIAANYIAQWNGSSWSPLGSGLNGANYPYVYALAVSGGTLYAGGEFYSTGDYSVQLNYIAQWNGSTWSALGPGMNNCVSALAVSGGTLYAGGSFYYTGDYSVQLNNIARWNGSSWSALDSGMSGGYPYVYALAVSGSTLYAGGSFTTAGGGAAKYIAQWNGSSWSALGSGINGGVYAVAVSGGTLYAGGNFTTAGGIAATNIAQWSGSNWSALGSGMGGSPNPYLYAPTVYALAVSGGTLYAGGLFTTAGGIPANYIAQWNGSSWSALGSGMNFYVSALAVSGGTLYAGGYFTTAGGSAANYIAQWNGSSWSALGSGINNGYYAASVDALAVSGGTLYAGGWFTTAGGIPANSIAQWNGSSWSALGSGMDNYVYALAVSGGTLYAGGFFSMAGGSAANQIAQWNGSNWSALGSGMNNGGYVETLAVSGGTLYAGGEFTTAGGGAATNIAQWNGSSWSALGPGVNSDVYALAADGAGHLFVGGAFDVAGTNVSSSIAQVNVASVPTILTPPQTQTAEMGARVDFAVDADGGDLTCQLFFNGTNLLSSGTNGDFVLTNVTFSQSGAYTVVVTNFLGAVTSAPVTLNVIAPVPRRGVPGVNLMAQAGNFLGLEYRDDLGPAANWETMATMTLSNSSQFYFDLSEPLPPQRFYRAWQTGTPAVVPSLDLNIVPAITLTGNIGDSLRLDYINQFGPTDAWVTLATVTLTNTSQLYFDTSSIGQPPRLWRIVPLP
jgi:hypothetical protein